MNKDQIGRDEPCLAQGRTAALWSRPTGMTSRNIGSPVASRVLWIALIIAPPRTLADLRRSFSAAVEKRIVAEIAKDLTGLTASDISQYLTA